MLTRFVAAIAALLLSFSVCAAQSCKNQKELAKSRSFPLKGELYGSSVALTDTYLLTNFHVVGKSPTATVTLPDKSKRNGVVVDKNWVLDLALVELDRPLGFGFQRLRLAASNPVVGDNTIMYSRQLSAWITDEVIDQRLSIFPSQFYTGLLGIRGDSGTGVFSCDGKLTGIYTGFAPRKHVKDYDKEKMEASMRNKKWVDNNWSTLSGNLSSMVIEPDYIRHFVCSIDSDIFSACSLPPPKVDLRSPVQIGTDELIKGIDDLRKSIK